MIKIPKNYHKGKRAFIIASGPSIKGQDLTWLKDEITICVNQSFRALDFEPNYIAIADEGLWKEVKPIYVKMKSRIIGCFANPEKIKEEYQGHNLSVLFRNLGHSKDGSIPPFSFNLEEGVISSRNVVPTVALPFAFWAGFEEIYLIGCDCTNDGYGYTDGLRMTEQKFHETTMDYYKAIVGYKGETKVFNCTKGGLLECFPRVNLGDLKHKFLVVGYYTKNGDYPKHAQKMKKNVEGFGLKCLMQEWRNKINDSVDPKVRWSLNANIKPYFLQRIRREFPNHNLFYLDVDATMISKPNLLIEGCRGLDFAAVFIFNKFLNKKQLCGGGLYFGTSSRANQLINLWAEKQRWKDEDIRAEVYKMPCLICQDQETLHQSLYLVDGLKWAELPDSYGYIEKTKNGKEIMPHVEFPVIIHHQASRSFRTNQ